MSILWVILEITCWATLVDNQPIKELCGFKFTEGPLWVKDLGWLFSDIPANRVYKLDGKEIFLEPSGPSNGLALDKEGNILIADHGNRRIVKREKNGTCKTLVDTYQGKRFNSPNDLVVRSDGTIFFTDPPYGLPGGLEGPNAELDFCGVYAIQSNGEVILVNKDLKKPNGIALSRDEKTLFVADTEQNAVFIFNLTDNRYPLKESKFCDVSSPDGIKMDTYDNLWVTSSEGIVVFNKAGERIEVIKVPQQPSNCAFGGKNGDELLVTARECVYLYQLKKKN